MCFSTEFGQVIQFPGAAILMVQFPLSMPEGFLVFVVKENGRAIHSIILI